MKNKLFPYIIFISAIAIAVTGGFFSVTGLSKLFAGSAIAIMVMGSVIEISKLVAITFLHRYWKVIKLHMKIYLTTGAIIISLITSAGIYGYLSSSYAATSGKMSVSQSQIDNLSNKKTFIQNEITALNQSKSLKTQRIQTLTGLRAQQETIMDSLYQRRQTASARRMQSEIEKSGQDIDKLNVENDSLDAKIQRKYVETSSVDTTVSSLQNNNTSAEVGPLKYIAKLTGKTMDQVANFFIMLLIFVFDPMAISLIIAANIAFEKLKDDYIEPVEPKKEAKPSFNIKNWLKKTKVLDNETLGLKKDASSIAAPLENFENNAKNDIESDTVNDTVNNAPNNNEIPQNTKKEIADYMSEEVVEKPAEVQPVVETVKSLVEPIKEEIIPQTMPQNIAENPIFKLLNVKNSSNFLNFLAILFEEGKRAAGSEIMKHKDFVRNLEANNITYTKEEIVDFFSLCNYFKITNMESSSKILAVSYEEAKTMFSKL